MIFENLIQSRLSRRKDLTFGFTIFFWEDRSNGRSFLNNWFRVYSRKRLFRLSIKAVDTATFQKRSFGIKIRPVVIRFNEVANEDFRFTAYLQVSSRMYDGSFSFVQYGHRLSVSTEMPLSLLVFNFPWEVHPDMLLELFDKTIGEFRALWFGVERCKNTILGIVFQIRKSFPRIDKIIYNQRIF